MTKFAVASKGRTDVGRVRSTNQDSFLIDHDSKIFIVADGMGGHAGGEIASQICVEQIQKHIQKHVSDELSLRKHPDPKVVGFLADSVNYASSKIYEHSLEDPSLRGMGTTATVIKVIDDQAYFAHVGDSRLYLVRKGFIYQITFDHSLVNEQVRAGIITPEEAEVHHLKNVITRSVGYQEEEDVDTSSFCIEDGDFLMLCSDGLHGKLSDAEISTIIAQKGINSIDELIDAANERGGEDNITAVVVAIKGA